MNFEHVADGLYALPPPSGASTFVYYLLATAPATPLPELSLLETWQPATEREGVGPSLAGSYLFLAEQISEDDAAKFASDARPRLPLGGGEDPRRLAWVTDPLQWAASGQPPAIEAQLWVQGPPGMRAVEPSDATFALPGELTLTLGAGTLCALADGSDGLVFAADAASNQLSFSYLGSLVDLSPPFDSTWKVLLPFNGAQAGGLVVPLIIDPGLLYEEFGGCIRFFHGDPVAAVSYPFFEWVPRSVQPIESSIQLQAFVHPLHPLEDDQTRFVLDLGGTTRWAKNAMKLHSPYLLTVGGGSADAVPVAAEAPPLTPSGVARAFAAGAPGFALAKGPPAQDGTGFAGYLTPVGDYDVVPQSAPGSGSLRLLCGLSATEFMVIGASGTTVRLKTGGAAYAPGFTPAAGFDQALADQSRPLDDHCTTSWWSVTAGAGTAGSGYYSQPSSLSYYGGPLVTGSAYPYAVAGAISSLAPAAGTQFPLALYAGIYAPSGQTAPSVGLVEQLEQRAIAQARRDAIPCDLTNGPQMVAADDLSVLPGGTVVTPEGQVVVLNGNGNWSEVQFARGPVEPSQYVRFTATGAAKVVDPQVSSELLRTQLNLVISRLDKMQGFEGDIDVGGFRFQLAPASVDPTAPLVHIFKFSTAQSLTELIATPEAWANADQWADVVAVQQAYAKSVAQAQATLGNALDPFAIFRNSVASDPNWTGVLSLNVPINGNGMPADLQMLFAGIDGQLTAHHFAMQMNQLEAAMPDAPFDLAGSSLSGVIYYTSSPSPPTPPSEPALSSGCEQAANDPAYSFVVNDLTVVFENSVVSDFHSTVSMRVDALFGRAVQLQGSKDNEVVIHGRYQRRGEVGTVTFNTTDPFVFTPATSDGQLVRVIERIVVSEAALVPVVGGSGKGPAAQATGSTIRSMLVFDGELLFAEQPFPGATDIDIFSYGNGGQGLAFGDLALDICCDLDSAGKRSGPTVIQFDASRVAVSASDGATRPAGLISQLPVKLSGFVGSAAALSPSALGALPVHVLELADFSAASASYAMRFDLPLGSLGSLASVQAGISASLVVGWGPATAVPDNDAVCLLVALPAASAGVMGFTFQGVLKTVFSDANLMRVPLNDTDSVWVVLFNNVQLSFLGKAFPPGVIVNFVLFADPAQPATSNLAWYLAAGQTQSEALAGKRPAL